LYAAERADVRIVGRIEFSGNTSLSGGACYGMDKSRILCAPTNGYAPVFTENRALMNGGACYIIGAGTLLELREASVGRPAEGNVCPSTQGGGGVAAFNNAVVTAINTRFEHNITLGTGGGLYLNRATAYVASEYTTPSAGPLPLAVFCGNTATNPPAWDVGRGGAACLDNGATATFINVAFVSNLSYFGGAICAQDGSDGLIINGVLAANRALGYGGALMNAASRTRLLHCTVADNRWNGIDTTGVLAAVTLTNCIIWGNTNLQVQSGQAVQYCDVQGGYPGTRNFSADPMFKDRAALDYQLLEPSPCIDTGVYVYVLRDCLGVLRTAGAGVDLGAYEFVPEPASWGVLGLFAMYNVRFAIWQRRREQSTKWGRRR
jgi:hypothetical protein